MSILNGHRSNVPPSIEGFSLNIKVSEKVLVTLFIVGASFSSGFTSGQSKAFSQPSALPAQNASCSPTTANNGLHR